MALLTTMTASKYLARFVSLVGVFAAMATTVATAQMTGLNPTTAEIRMLPQFCWAQMKVPNADTPQYKPAECGAFTNHYCPALVHLARAKRLPDKVKAYKLLQAVDREIRYTKTGIANFPYCTIRSHVDFTEKDVQRLLKAYEAVAKAAKPPR